MPTRKRNTNPKLKNWLLRSLLVIGPRSHNPTNAGFVLPTVVMVSLVVVLLTTAMVLRSFDRSKNASSARVNETVLNAASPALDRARLKIDALFADPALPRGTPSETEMYTAIATKDRYTFGDEDRLKVAHDINGGGISTAAAPLQDQEVATTAWRFPVDTDNNGRFDSYTLYGIYLRSPSVGSNGEFNRARNPLEARSAPMVDDRTLNAQCRNAFGGPTSSTFLSSTGWYRVNDVLKKSFFVYTATVPLTSADPIVGSNPTRYEAYRGNKGFSALELQQDRSRIPIYNAAVLYEDDLEVTPGPQFQLNGRIFTNSNFLPGQDSGAIRFFQISSTNSCYIQNEENSKIVVGGNVGYGSFTGGSTGANGVQVDLKRGNNINLVNINNDRKTADNTSTQISYNSQAYTERIDFLVRSAVLRGGAQTLSGTYPNQTVASNDPPDVRSNIASRLNSNASLDPATVRQEELERYFRQRTRRVPYQEVAFGTSIIGTTVNGVTIADTTPADGIADANINIFPATGKLRPPDVWAMPTAADGITSTGYTTLTLKGAGTTMELPMTEPEKRRVQYNREERLMGDRVFVGNNLPFLRYITGSDSFIGSRTQQLLAGKTWDDGDGTRYRETRIEELPDLGVSNRNGFWEQAATEPPVNALDNVGGLRVITGAGIYFNRNSTIANISGLSWFEDRSFGRPNPFRAAVGAIPTLFTGEPAPLVSRDAATLAGTATTGTRYSVVWPDSMPMTPGPIAGLDTSASPLTVTTKPDLRMRATAVYHYRNNTGIDQTPIACISSYYDPTNETTAKNQVNFDGGFGIDTTNGKSNNGVVYPPPYTPASARLTTAATYMTELRAQAQMMFPNGRIVNEPLQNALKKLTAAGALVNTNNPLSLDENGAIDTALCSIRILDGTISSATTSPTSGFTIPHGAIREVAFLDGRQVKAIDSAQGLAVSAASSTTTSRTYTMSNTGTLKVGDVVTIGGFVDNPSTTTINEGELNVTRGTITARTVNTSITVAGGSTAAIGATTGGGRVLEALTGNYDLALEERQPLEVRATAIDLNAIKTQVTGATPPEYLFPNSGIIYASRDDALLDLSGPSQDKVAQRRSSPVDYRLDPSRRPSGILLENGASLGRVATYRPEEKGLVLATDLPVYIKGDFNLHSREEFTQTLGNNLWTTANFYTNRSTLDDNFACRVGQYAECTTGDPWRPTTVLADAITPLSAGFRYGFRNEGDYDLNNQTGSKDSITVRRRNGFWNNVFAINGLSSGGLTVGTTTPTDADYRATPATANNAVNSSYFNNFVTPVQRRGTVPTYVMEICRKVPVSACGPADWVVGFDINGDGTLGTVTVGTTAYNEANITASQLGRAIELSRIFGGLASADTNANGIITNAELNWATGYATGGNTRSILQRLGGGSTGTPALQEADRRFARRVAFGRDRYNALVFTTINDTTVTPNVSRPVAKPFGVGCPVDATGTRSVSNGCEYPNSTTRTENVHYGTQLDNALWFRTTDTVVGNPGANASITYRDARPLAYIPPDEGGTKLILPDLPDLAPINLLNQGSPRASDYTVCTSQQNGYVSTDYQATFPVTATSAACRSMIANGGSIDVATDALLSNAFFKDITYNQATHRSATTNIYGGFDYNFDAIDGNGDGITLVAFPSNIPNGSVINLNAGTNANAVFVLQVSSNLNLGANNCGTINSTINCNGVVLNLNGNISPNNVIWVVSGSANLNNVNPDRVSTTPYPSQATRIAGTFMGKAGGMVVGTNVNIDGGRFLGFTTVSASAGSTVTASADDGQPLLTPVLQLQTTTLTAGNTTTRDTATNLPTGTNSNVVDTKWLPTADVETTFNLVAAAGDTPARPAEDNGGLHNFLRFIEMWSGTNVKAAGSFVQYKRSVYATAPWQPLLDSGNGGIYNTTGGLFGYRQTYQTANSAGRVPFYQAPNRRWGFDVALLKQRRPDLLAERFSTEPVLSANEFFREVPRNDAWVTSLMCAKVVSNNSNAVNNAERPANCPTGNW